MLFIQQLLLTLFMRVLLVCSPLHAVVEIYAKWCGPSQACMSTYRMFKDEYIDQKRRLRLCRLCATQLATELTEFDAFKSEARPKFWLMHNGEKVGTVLGVNTPALEKLVSTLTPDGYLEGDDDEEKTEGDEEED